MKYISHLDILRLFQRAVRRAKLPVSFSQGYHPIPKISFKRALKLGLESDGEEMFLKLNSYLDPKVLEEKLNEQLPDGIKITVVRCIAK